MRNIRLNEEEGKIMRNIRLKEEEERGNEEYQTEGRGGER